MIDLVLNYEKIKLAKHGQMSEGRRYMKYHDFLNTVSRFRFGLKWFGPKESERAREARGDFLDAYYLFHRCLDDPIDGDAKLPRGHQSLEAFIDQKIRFSKSLKNPLDELDHLLLYCYQLAEEFGEDFKEETTDILESMAFDVTRRDYFRKREGMMITPREELGSQFDLLDVRGTTKGTLKIFGEDPEKYTYLQPLAVAERIHYNLRDFAEDIHAGYVNIPEEDVSKFQILEGIWKAVRFQSWNYLSLLDRIADSGERKRKKKKFVKEAEVEFLTYLPYQISGWFLQEAQDGLELLAEYKQNLKEVHFRWLTRWTLKNVYEKKARAYFKKVIKTLDRPNKKLISVPPDICEESE
ncbi:MAG: hypothetical protein V3V78_02350 [Candidatus Woesearchaeota archaeon]